MSTSGGEILGLDNVRLDLPLAGIGSRLLAATLDYFLLFLVQLVFIIGAGTLLAMLDLGGWAMALVIIGIFLIQWGYFAFLEILTEGSTPGKRLLGVRVVSRFGGRASVLALLIRNLVRTIDVLVGLPLILFEGRRRRLGDMVAGTLVVHQRQEHDIEAESRSAVERHPESWGAREVAVVESFLRRADRLEAGRAESMANQLLAWIERRESGFWQTVAPTLPATGDPVSRLRAMVRPSPSPSPSPSGPGVAVGPEPPEEPRDARSTI